MLCISILPFDARDKLNDKYECQSITSTENLLDLLMKHPGDADKPVRLIKEEKGSILIAKFSSNSSRKDAIDDELENLRILSNFSPFIANLKWGETCTKGSVICTEYIQPYLKIHNLRQLVSSHNDIKWRETLFQTIFTLLNLQKKFPGFRHNDFKADNILVTQIEPKLFTFLLSKDVSKDIKRYWKFRSDINIKIIDFELACTPEASKLKSRCILSSSETFHTMFGLSKTRCDIFDIHLLLFDALTSAKGKLLEDLKLFIFSFFSKEYFDPKHLTVQRRLKIEDQIHLQDPNMLVKMLAHPYFFHFRCDPLETEFLI